MASGSSATARVSGVEFYRMGQTNFAGRYPMHWHLLGNTGSGGGAQRGPSVLPLRAPLLTPSDR